MSESEDDPGRRETAYRLFATEYDDADFEFSESEEERAPKYVVTPTGARINRLFVVGVLTEVEPVSDDVLRGRVVDPTGAFVIYAGQYQPDERTVLDRTNPPAFVAVTGKARTFQPEESSRVLTSVRPESISVVDRDTRDRWTVDASEQTLHRVEAMATGLALGVTGDRLRDALVDRGYRDDLAAGVALAIKHYETTPTYLSAVKELAIDAARHVGGDLDEVPELTVEPSESGDVVVENLLPEPIESLSTEKVVEGSEETDSVESDSVSEEASEATQADELESDSPKGVSESGEKAEIGGTDLESSDGPNDLEASEYDLDESEREAVESEYGTEFQSATEVDGPGEADIEIAQPDESTTSSEDSSVEDQEEEAVEEMGLVDTVISAMNELDEGDGAEYSQVISTVVDQTGADVTEVEDAIQEALMDGRCYEPDDTTLKPI